MLAYGLADTCRSMITGRKQLNRSASSFASAGSQESAASVGSMCVAGSISIIAQPSTLSLNAMPKDRRIVITKANFALLNRLVDHPRLASELDKAAVVDSRLVSPDVVTMNSRLLYEDESTGERHKVTIVFPQQADPSKAFVSVLAPVGTALLGLAVGQSILWPFPDGAMHSLRVLRVIYQPEQHHAPSPCRKERLAAKAG